MMLLQIDSGYEEAKEAGTDEIEFLRRAAAA